MLGVAHRAALGLGPPQLLKLLPKIRPLAGATLVQMADLCGEFCQDYMSGSTFGKLQVYNALPESILADQHAVKNFQRRLQDMLFNLARTGCILWPSLYR